MVDYDGNTGLSGDELDGLESFLLFESGLLHPMELETLDGFLTAIIVGPEIVKPAEWLAWVWDTSGNGASPKFQSAEEESRITGIVMRLMKLIVVQLQEEPDEYRPLPDRIDYADVDSARRAARAWSVGFMLGVRVWSSSWTPLLKNEMAASTTVIIGVVAGMFRESLQIDEEKEYKFWYSVPDAVLDIREFWVKRML
ncbi:MAG: YecA family protein, partial [Chlorobiaceae bacterium]|nr:YecA family protein [Chlorobiaceae bacterium]